MSRAIPVIFTSGEDVAQFANALRTFAYALVGQQRLAEDMAIEVLRSVSRGSSTTASQMVALERIMHLARVFNPADSSFQREVDAPLRDLTLEQRAVVALRAFLHVELNLRLAVLGMSQDEERKSWMAAINAMKSWRAEVSHKQS